MLGKGLWFWSGEQYAAFCVVMCDWKGPDRKGDSRVRGSDLLEYYRAEVCRHDTSVYDVNCAVVG